MEDLLGVKGREGPKGSILVILGSMKELNALHSGWTEKCMITVMKVQKVELKVEKVEKVERAATLPKEGNWEDLKLKPPESHNV